MKVKLGDICDFQSGGTPTKSKQEYFNGTIPWITTVALNGDRINERNAVDWITDKAIQETAAKIVPANSIMVGTRVGIGKVAINSVDMSTNQDIISLIQVDEKQWNKDYLCKFIQGKSNYLLSQARGATIKGIKKDILANLELEPVSLEEQTNISNILDKIKLIISHRQKELSQLDVAKNARFSELFGDPVANDKNWPIVTIADIAEVKIGPFGTLLHKEDYIEGGHALVNPSHIKDGKIVVDSHLTINDEKYHELSAYHLQIGDIVFGRRGEMGRCAVVKKSGLLCGTGSLIIRPSSKIKPYFLQNILSSPGYKKIIEEKAVGITMLNVNVPIVSALNIPLLPINLQNQFIQFMSQVVKSKVAIKRGMYYEHLK